MKFDGDKRFYVTQRQMWALEKMIGEVERAPRELHLDTRHLDDEWEEMLYRLAENAAADAVADPVRHLRWWMEDIEGQEIAQ